MYDPVNPLWDICPKEMSAYFYQMTGNKPSICQQENEEIKSDIFMQRNTLTFLIHIVSMATSVLQGHSWVVETETTLTTKLFFSKLSTGKVHRPLLWSSKNRLQGQLGTWDESHRYYVEWEKPGAKNVHTIEFHLYKVPNK